MNARQKKKKIKQKILTLKPDQLLMIKVPAYEYDIETLQSIFNQYKEIIPKDCTVLISFDNIVETLYNKQSAYEYLKNITKCIKEQFGELNESTIN